MKAQRREIQRLVKIEQWAEKRLRRRNKETGYNTKAWQSALFLYLRISRRVNELAGNAVR